MSWKEYTANDRDEMIKLLSGREYCGINYSVLFRKMDSNKYQAGDRPAKICIYSNSESGKIDFAIIASRNGQLLPLAQKPGMFRQQTMEKAFPFFGESLKYIHTIMGDKKSVNYLIKAFYPDKEITEGKNSFSYYTMVLEKNNFCNQFKIDKDINIRYATPKDTDKLLLLQKNYEIEEVLPSPSMFDKSLSKRHLAATLKEQTTVIAEKCGKIISKANTNGKGSYYEQIGGVYTLPEYRNSGISTFVVSVLADNILSRGFKVSLFVKTANHPAIKVYNKLGFKKMEEFQITYFLYQ